MEVTSEDPVFEVPLGKSNIEHLLDHEINRVRLYLSNPQLQPSPNDIWSKFREIKVDGHPVPFALCLCCRAVYQFSHKSIASVLGRHICPGKSSQPLPQDETDLDEVMNRRMSKVSYDSTPHINEEVKYCFQYCKWADVQVICCDYQVRVHSMVLAASCPLLYTAIKDIPESDKDDNLVIMIPDVNRDELIPFISHLYGQTLDTTDFNSFLFTFINFDRQNINLGLALEKSEAMTIFKAEEEKIIIKREHNIEDSLDFDMNDLENPADNFIVPDDEDEDEHCSDEEDSFPDLKTKDIKRMLIEEPNRITLKEASSCQSGRNTKVWKYFHQVFVDGSKVSFVNCKFCDSTFLHTKNTSTTIIKKHVKTHANEDLSSKEPESAAGLKSSEIKKIMAEEPHRLETYDCDGNSEVWSHFKLLKLDGAEIPFAKCLSCNAVFVHTNICGTTTLKKHFLQHSNGKYTPGRKRIKLFNVKKENDTTRREWDKSTIQMIKDELEAPSQKTGTTDQEISPGVSKFAISQLIQAGSERVAFEESTTHSAVWEKFVKVVLDTVEVPFVCCKLCRKVYTHDRTLGTSSLIRHQCTDEHDSDKTSRAGGLPRILVQELVNTNSSRVSTTPMNDKFEQRLKDVTSIFARVLVDEKETEFISCGKCNKLYLFSQSKNNILLVKKIEQHECYIRHAPSMHSYPHPTDEKELYIVSVREPERLSIQEKIKNEPNLHYFLLDGIRTDFAHCTKCTRFFPLSALNFNEERIHRCHRVKTADHKIKFKKKIPHQCDKCDAVFKSEHFLEIHMRRIHAHGSATVMCSHCAKEFPTERLAKKHEMHVHYPEISKKFPCKDCDAMFHDRSKLKLHAMKHSNIKPYVCEQCGKGFNWVASFQDHMDMHMGIKKYTCEYCQRQFTKRNTLNNHRRLHTGEKPFLCPASGCGMAFVQRTACKTHAKKRHNIEIQVYTRNPDVPQSSASLAQMSLAQKLEQQQLQERVLQQRVDVQIQQPQTIQVQTLERQVGTPTHITQISGDRVVQLTGGERVQLTGGERVIQLTGTERIVHLTGGERIVQIGGTDRLVQVSSANVANIANAQIQIIQPQEAHQITQRDTLEHQQRLAQQERLAHHERLIQQERIQQERAQQERIAQAALAQRLAERV